MADLDWTVGHWTRRTRARPWHKAQSVLNDKVVTKCGKQMALRDKKGNELTFKDPSAGVTLVPFDATRCQSCFTLP